MEIDRRDFLAGVAATSLPAMAASRQAVFNRLGGTTYYVSNSGSDGNNGTSPSTPWATITPSSRVNTKGFQPGDSILFQAGGGTARAHPSPFQWIDCRCYQLRVIWNWSKAAVSRLGKCEWSSGLDTDQGKPLDIVGCALLLNADNQWQGSWTLDYNLWSPLDGGGAPGVCSNDSPSLATWASRGYGEAHGLINIAPKLVNQMSGDFTPATGSPLLNAGVNLYASGVMVDYNGNPRPTTGAFTIGAIQ